MRIETKSLVHPNNDTCVFVTAYKIIAKKLRNYKTHMYVKPVNIFFADALLINGRLDPIKLLNTITRADHLKKAKEN